MLGSAKEKILTGGMALAILLTGCGGKAGGEIPQKAEQEFYYAIEETTLPDSRKTLTAPEGGRVDSFDPFLIGERVFRCASENTHDYQSQGFYLQYLQAIGVDSPQWKNINILESAFELDDIEYDGLNSMIYASTDGEMYTSAYILEKESSYLVRFGEEQVAEIICEIPKGFKEEWDATEKEKGTGTLAGDCEGNFYSFFRGSDEINCYDAMLEKQRTVTVPKYVYGIMQGAAGEDVYWYGCGMDNKPVIGNLTGEEILLEGVEGIATDYMAEISTEGVLFLADTQNVWRVENGVPQKVFQFTGNGYLISELYGMEAGKQGEIVFLVKMDGDLLILRMNETQKPGEKQEIVLAFANQHLALNRSIARFNRQNKEYHISLMLPEEGEDEEAFRKRIQLELSAGRGPDIMGHDIVLNPADFVENDYLECLDDVFEDTSLYLEAALEVSEKDGKLYGVPYDCTFEFVSYAKESVGERTCWTLPELMEAVEASEAEILVEGFGGVAIVKYFALYDNSNTTYIDWETGKSHLTEQPFLDLLAFAKEYGDYDTQGKKAFGLWMNPFMWLKDVKEIYSYFDGGAAMLGYSRTEGNGIYVSTRELYLNANSVCKEGAKEFLKFLVSETEQKKYITYDSAEQMREEGLSTLSGHMNQFPIALEAYDTLVEGELEADKGNVIYTDNGVIQLEALYTEEMIEQFYFMLEHAEPARYNASAIENIIAEELTPYFEGDITAKEAAQKLDNRVQLFLDENN